MDIQKILDFCYHYSDKEKLHLRGWLTKVDSKYSEGELLKALSNSKGIYHLFYLQNNCGISRQTYQRIARHIRSLLDYYGLKTTIPIRENILISQEVVSLFKDLDTLIEKIDYIGNIELQPNYDKEKDLLTIKALAILGWHGFNLHEIATIEKSTLCENQKCYYVEKTEIAYPYYVILKKLADSTGYKRFPGGKVYSYRGNEHLLFRNAVEDGDISKSNLMNQLVGFNSVAEKYKFKIAFSQLRKNAMFVEVNKNSHCCNVAEIFVDKYRYSKRTSKALEKEYFIWEKDTK